MFHFMHLPLTEWRAPVSFLLRFESLLMIRPSVNTVAQITLRLVPSDTAQQGHAELYHRLEGL